jgi:cobalt/nickel transport system permease protein
MRHAFIDTYAGLNTPLHNLNPTAKIIFLITFLPVIVLTPVTCKLLFLFYGLCAVILICLSKVPLSFILKRLANVIPFIIVVSISALFRKQGYILFIGCALKSTLASLFVLLISATTRFTKILDALKRLGVPELFIYLFSFMYRYSFLLEDQLLRVSRAWASRSVNRQGNFAKAKILSNILGSLFIRTYERAERVYLAMCARGYSND